MPSSSSTRISSPPRCRTIPISPASCCAISRELIANRFPDAIEHHRLRREIIATNLANSMINRGGPAFVARIADQTGASVERIAAAFAAVRDSFSLTAINTAIEELDNRIDGADQLALFTAVQNLLIDRVVWFLRNVDLGQGLAGIVEHYRSGIAAVLGGLDAFLSPEAQRARGAETQRMMSDGVPDPLARTLAGLPMLASAADIHPHRRPHRPAGRRDRADLFCRNRVFPTRPHRRGRGFYQTRRLLRPACVRPRPRLHR